MPNEMPVLCFVFCVWARNKWGKGLSRIVCVTGYDLGMKKPFRFGRVFSK